MSDYERKKRSARERQAEITFSGQDIGPPPPPADQKRRDGCERDFGLFLLTYFGHVFTRPFCPDVLRIIALAQDVVLKGGLQAEAEPRGFGKTTRARCLAVWALLYGHRRFVVLIGKNATSAKKILENIKQTLRFNKLLAADFPEVCHPIAKLSNRANRAKGQHIDGKPTDIAWRATQIVLPTVEGSISSGSMLWSVGITSSEIRGMQHERQDGTVIRPDLVLVDDPQDRKSAASVDQIDKLERVIVGDILGTAEPGKKIAALMLCTVIYVDDLSDRLLNRQRNPEWRGVAHKLLKVFPTHLKKWDEYRELWAEGLRTEKGIGEATEFYVANHAEMDDGAEAADPLLYDADEVSAVQHAMNLFFRNEEQFYSEQQNEPRRTEEEATRFNADKICEKLTRLPQRKVPVAATQLVAFIDVADEILFYCIAAVDHGFSGSVIDYGPFPDQVMTHWQKRSPRPTLTDWLKARGIATSGKEGVVYEGLKALATRILDPEYEREGTGTTRITRCLIDANYSQLKDTVYQFCRESKHAGILLPSHGKGIGASGTPLSQWRQGPGERIGLEWRIARGGKWAWPYVMFDANFWKSFTRERMHQAQGDRGSVALFGEKPAAHRLFCEHLASETPVKTMAEQTGRKAEEWKLTPGRDNEGLDALVGCMLAASIDGAILGRNVVPARKSIKQLQEEARARREGKAG